MRENLRENRPPGRERRGGVRDNIGVAPEKNETVPCKVGKRGRERRLADASLSLDVEDETRGSASNLIETALQPRNLGFPAMKRGQPARRAFEPRTGRNSDASRSCGSERGSNAIHGPAFSAMASSQTSDGASLRLTSFAARLMRRR